MQVKKFLYIAPALAVAGTIFIGGSVIARQKHYEPTGPDSFLNYQVDSTDELVQALREDPKLRKRYAKHFGIPESEVVDWVKRALVPTRLTADRKVNVYGVTKTGRIYPVRTTLKKGTKVWATRSGVPVLKWACANPLTREMPGTRLPAPARPAVTRAAAPGGRINTLGLAPSAVVVPSAIAAPAAVVPAGGAFVAAAPLAGGGGAAALAFPSAVLPVVGGGGGGINLAAFLPVAALLLPRGGGGETVTEDLPGITLPPPTGPTPPPTTIVPPPGPEGPVAIPEPGTMALMALAAPLGLIAGIRRLRRDSKQNTG